MVNRSDKPSLVSGLDDLDEVFGALGAWVRRGVLERLRGGPLPVMSLADAFPVSWPAVSKHLKVLEEAGLVVRTKEGRVHRIALAPGALERAAGWLDGFERAPAAASTSTSEDNERTMVATLAEEADRLLALVSPCARRLRTALEAPGVGLSAVLAERLADAPELATQLMTGLAACEELRAVLAGPRRGDRAALQAATFQPARLVFLLRHHPLLADLPWWAPEPAPTAALAPRA